MKSTNLISFYKICLIAVMLVNLSACQMWELVNYQWQNAKAEAHWQEGKEYAVLPFKKLNGHILVSVQVNGSEPMTFVLDSGAAATVITETLVTNNLNLPKNRAVKISGQGEDGNPTAFVVHDVRIDVGDFFIQNMSVIYVPTDAMPFDSLEETYFDGVLGADFFNCCLVEVNHDQQKLYLSKLESGIERRYSGPDWQKLAMTVEGNTPYLHTQIDDGESIKSVKLILDTGSTGALDLFTGNNIIAIPQKTYQARSTGISGDTVNQVGLLPQLDVGPYSFNDFPSYFRTQGGEPQKGSHGVLGSKVLQQLNIVFDFTNQVLWVQPNMSYPLQIHADKSGLRILPHVLGGIVKDIARGTGAEALHIKKNSIVTHINNQKLTVDSFDDLIGILNNNTLSKVPICWQNDESNSCGFLQLSSRL